MGDYRTTAEAARILGITRGAVALAIRQGRLKATRVGGRWRIHIADIEDYRGTYRPQRRRPPGRRNPGGPRGSARSGTSPRPRPQLDPGVPALPAARPASVSERDWTALVRHVRDGLAYAAIAAELQISPQRAQQLVARASVALQSPDLADLGRAARGALVAAGYTTRDAVAQASDADLLKLKGMSDRKLQAVRRVVPRAR